MGKSKEHVELKGSCLCGAHRYRAMGQLMGFYHCHCSRCRKASGTGHASNILLQPGQLELAGDRDRIGVYKVPGAARFASRFCRECGGPLPRFERESAFVVAPAGTLDEPITLQPQARIFWASRAAWSCSGQALPEFAGFPAQD